MPALSVQNEIDNIRNDMRPSIEYQLQRHVSQLVLVAMLRDVLDGCTELYHAGLMTADEIQRIRNLFLSSLPV
jgi:hypothetical protein